MADDTLVKTIEVHNVRVDGYDAAYWNESYKLLRDAIVEHLGEFTHDDDCAEEAILCKAVEEAGETIHRWPAFAAYIEAGGYREHGSFLHWAEGRHALSVQRAKGE